LESFIVNEDKIIHVESDDTSIKRFFIKADQGTITESRYSFFTVRPERGGSLSLSIYNNNDIEHPVFIEKKEVMVFAEPEANIAGKSGGDISREELLKEGKVLCTGDYRVERYKLSIVSNEINRDTYSTGEILTENMLAALEKVHPGGKIHIEYIHIIPKSGGRSREATPLTFTLIL
jgi:hypothetical protein